MKYHDTMTTIEDKWRTYYEDMLNRITGKQPITQNYTHSIQKRIWSLFNLALCTVTCCAPCCVYDTICCIAHKACRRYRPGCCPYGVYCMFGQYVIENVYDTTNKIVPHTKLDVSRKTVCDMCIKYLTEFDECVVQHTERSAKAANEIREYLVYFLQTYLGYPTLTDDGDVDKLRTMIENAAK